MLRWVIMHISMLRWCINNAISTINVVKKTNKFTNVHFYVKILIIRLLSRSFHVFFLKYVLWSNIGACTCFRKLSASSNISACTFMRGDTVHR